MAAPGSWSPPRHRPSGARARDARRPLLAHVIAAACAAFSAGAGADCSAAEPVVLLTAFGPFDGRGVNGSATVAHRLEGEVVAGARISILVLPVRWGEPERRLPEAVLRLHPVLLLGVGEGLPGATVYVEREGANQARPYRDADGALPPSAVLDAAAPAVLPVRLRCDLAWFAPAACPVADSRDAGGYLCNELLFTALRQPVAACGFVHLPPQGAAAAAGYADAYAPIVRTLIARNLATAAGDRTLAPSSP